MSSSIQKRQNRILTVLLVLSFFVFILSVRLGAVPVTTEEMAAAVQKYFSAPDQMTLNERIFMAIRLPRALLCLIVGASLAVGGTLMQALFRNPIVEPGMIGTSSGAALGAAFYFVLGALLHFNAGEWTLPVAACTGGILSTMLVLALSRSGRSGKSSVVALLLTGIAINALCLSAVGFLSYIARDPQARSITFWGLGTLSGANWHSVAITGISAFVCITISLYQAKHLNALIMGESEARMIGVDIKKLKLIVLSVNVVMVSVATAFVGIISFIGLVVPHLLRMAGGADNRYLIRNSALLGGILLGIADLVARLLLVPAELPIGIVTSVVGVPVFLVLLKRNNYFF